jgi:wobble nucleotide-excising tRNase
MIINRIRRIKGYRIFRDFTWPEGLPEFSKFNLIYGWNGSGKTTLSNLFLYLQRKENITDGEVQFQINGSVVDGSALAESEVPKIRVFNRSTVDLNLFEVPNKELPPVYYLGEGADKQRRLEELADQRSVKEKTKSDLQEAVRKAVRNRDDFCANKASEIKNLLTSPRGAYNQYDRRNFKEAIDRAVSFEGYSYCLLPAEYEKRLAAKDGKVLEPISLLQPNLPSYKALLDEVKELLTKSVVSGALKELVNNPDMANWVQKGLTLHTKEEVSPTCHFCHNTLSEERIKQVENHFNDQLVSFQFEVDDLIERIIQSKIVIESLSFPDANLLYSHLREEYKSEIALWGSTKLMVGQTLDSLVNALMEKKSQPFKVVDVDDFLSLTSEKTPKTWGDLLSFFLDVVRETSTERGLNKLVKVNTIINKHNDYSQNFSQEIATTKRIIEAHVVGINLIEYLDLNENISDLNKDLEKSDKDLTDTDDAIRILELERGHIRASEELNEEMASYLGRDELRFEVQDNGYIISRNGLPAMHLSEGERTAIAFMYFLKTLEDSNFDMENGVVVIDDPISSLDSNSMYSAFGFMKERTKSVKQLFVLTHSFSFFRQVRGWFFRQPGQRSPRLERHPSRFYMLESKVEGERRTSHISALDPLLQNYESEYHYLFKKVYEEAQREGNLNELENYYGLPNIGRRLLESFLTFKLPNLQVDKLEKKLDEIR